MEPLKDITNKQVNTKIKQTITKALKVHQHEKVKECKTLVRSFPRKIAFLYANPRIPPSIPKVHTLNALTREMRYVLSFLNPFDFIMQPATTTNHLRQTLKTYKPEITTCFRCFW